VQNLFAFQEAWQLNAEIVVIFAAWPVFFIVNSDYILTRLFSYNKRLNSEYHLEMKKKGTKPFSSAMFTKA